MDVCLDCLSVAAPLGNMAGFLIAATVRLLFSHLAGISSGGNHLFVMDLPYLLAAYEKANLENKVFSF